MGLAVHWYNSTFPGHQAVVPLWTGPNTGTPNAHQAGVPLKVWHSTWLPNRCTTLGLAQQWYSTRPPGRCAWYFMQPSTITVTKSQICFTYNDLQHQAFNKQTLLWEAVKDRFIMYDMVAVFV